MRAALTAFSLAAATAASLLVPANAAQAAGCTTPTCHTGPRYTVVSLKTTTGATLTQLGAISSCKSAGGTCTITKANSKSTAVGTSFGLSKGFVSGLISVNVNKTSATSVSCTSPKLKSGQIYRAYTRGVHKSYKLKRVYAGKTSTSSTKHAYEPYRSSIDCRVEKA